MIEARWKIAVAVLVAFGLMVQVMLLRWAMKNDRNVALLGSKAPAITSECRSKIQPFLTSQEKHDSLDIILCSTSSSLLADLVIKDRSTIRNLHRREYLRDLRSYRLSGLICNNHLDETLPPVASEPAFKCLTPEYQRRACMDGRTSYPHACNAFVGYGGGTENPYIPETEREQMQQKTNGMGAESDSYPQECKELAEGGVAKCNEGLVGINDGTSPSQLAAGVAEAKVLTKSRTDNKPIWRKEALDLHLSIIQQGGDVGPIDYPGSHQALQKALEVISVKHKSVAIFGSISPWVESILHYNGAKSPTMTVDYNQPISFDERMETELMSTMLEADTQFDVIVSYSSIEHDGQGRYGDPLDPDGDFASMKECWLKVAPGGYFLLHVPLEVSGKDQFFWYSMREYGAYRLPLLVRGWKYVGCVTSKKVYGPNDEFTFFEVANDSPILILRKPPSVEIDDVLDVTKFEGIGCDITNKKCRLNISRQ